MNIRNEIDRASPIVDRLNDAIRENPLAAGVIGAGLAWMLFGSKGLATIPGMAKDAAAGTISAVGAVGGATADRLRSAGKAAASAARGAASTVADRASSIVPDIEPPDTAQFSDAAAESASALSDGLKSVSAAAGEYGGILKSRLSDSLERQPLLLGAIGLAIGACIASSFATTKAEQEWIGEQGAQARETVQGALNEAKDRAQEVLSEVQEEASRQGLTLEAAKEAASSVAGKLRNVADSAGEAAKKPFTASTGSSAS
jgi:hypothetical protein